MNKQQYHLAIISEAPVNSLEQAKMKGMLLIELATQIEQKEAEAKAKAEAEKSSEQSES